MEDQETPKRKYKKHKEGFKIVIEYKLNTKLKGLESFEGLNLYPIYVEVRVKRKRFFFPSLYEFYVLPEEFDKFKANELVKAVFEEESTLIKGYILKHYENSTNESDNNWYNSYRSFIPKKLIYHQLRRSIELKIEYQSTLIGSPKHRLIDALLFEKGEYIQNTLNLLVSMKQVDFNPLIQELIYLLRTYLRIEEFLSLYSREWLSPDLKAIFRLENSISTPFLLENQTFKHKVQSIGYQSDQLYSDMTSLSQFIDSVKMFN